MYFLYLISILALTAEVLSNSSEDGSLDKTGDKTTNCTCGWRGQVEDKIVGGELAGEGEFPSQIRLYLYYNGHLHGQCGGTILTEKYSLLASHCLLYSNSRDLVEGWYLLSFLRVAYGIANTTGLKESDTLKVEKYHNYNPKYSSINDGPRNDIALLKVKGKFEFGPNVGPACFPTVEEPMEPNVDTDVLAIGYGYTSWSYEPVVNDLLYKVHLNREWHLKNCSMSYHFTDKNICTMTPGKSVCSGDSGGPLFFYDKEIERYVLVGVAIFTSPPPDACQLGGFIKVGSYRNWILTILSGDGENLCMKQ